MRILVIALTSIAFCWAFGTTTSAHGDELTMPQFYRLQDDLLKSQLAESHERSPFTGRSCDRLVNNLLGGAVKSIHRRDDRPEPSRLHLDARRVFEAGCESAVVLFIRGVAQDEMDRRSSASHYYIQAADRAHMERLHPGPFAHLSFRLAKTLAAYRRHDEARHYYALTADQLVELARGTPPDLMSQRLFVATLRHVVDDLPGEHVKSIAHRLEQLPDFDTCTLLTALGMIERRLGWEARGSGFADMVTEEGWVAFHKHLTRAGVYCRRAYEVDPSRPEAPGLMIGIVATGHGLVDETAEKWFDRAIAAQTDWTTAYTDYLNYLRPRWGGSHERQIAFAKRCVDTGRFDTFIPQRVINLLRNVISDANGEHTLIASLDLYPLAETAIQGLLADPVHTSRRGYYTVTLLVTAWASGRYDEARELLHQLPDTPSTRQAWYEMYADRRIVTDEVIAFSSPLAEEIRAADRLMAQASYKDAEEQYAMLQNRTDEENVARILRDRQATAGNMAVFESGEWVDFTFDADLAGWHPFRNRWRIVDDATSVRMQHQYTRPLLISSMEVGRRWEAQCEIDFTGAAAHALIDAGIMIGFARRGRTEYAQFFTLLPHQNEARWGYRLQSSRRTQLSRTMPWAHSGQLRYPVHIKVWDERIAVRVDNELVFVGAPQSRKTFEHGRYFGIGGTYDWPAREVVFRNLRLRRLTETPAEFADAAPVADDGAAEVGDDEQSGDTDD